MWAALAGVLVAAAVVPLAYRRWPRAAAWGAVAVAGVVALGFAACVPAIAGGARLAGRIAWAPALGVDLALQLDGLALLFAIPVAGIGALVLIYAIGYLGHGPRLGRMLGLLLLFEGAMLGLVLADDTVALVVFWELTSISSYFLIGFDRADRRARRNAAQALAITGTGGLALLAGVVLLAHAAGSGVAVAPSELAGRALREHALYPAIVVLIAGAAFTKSALVPFHGWLPNAMVAPTPVSAYLHSAAMVKAGLYVLARFAPALDGTALWTGLLTGVGAATAVAGGALALVQRDLKLVLAYSTISVLGTLTALLGIGGEAALTAFGAYLLAHAAYKAALFMVAGNVDHHRGHRDAFALGRLAGELPASAAAAAIAAGSMAGLPPLLGYLGKEAAYAAAAGGPARWVVVPAVAAAGALMIAAAGIAGFAPFFRGGVGTRGWRDAPATMLVGPLVLAGATVALGAVPGVALAPLVGAAAGAIAGREVEPALARWHLPGAGVLAVSVASLLAGIAAYVAAARRAGRDGGRLRRWSTDRAYEAIVRGGSAACAAIAGWLAGGSLRAYAAITLGVAALAVGVPIGLHAASVGPGATAAETAGEACVMLLAGAGAIGTAAARGRLAAMIFLGAAGLAIALLFALVSAPDLAITQLVVETLMVVLLISVLRHLPGKRAEPRPPRIALVLAGAAGAVVTLLLLAAPPAGGFPRDASRAYLAGAAAREADNVVNAIVVDFRAIDTLGEITVLASAGIGVLALIRLAARPRSGR